MTSRLLASFLSALLVSLLSSCNLLVDVPVAEPLTVARPIEPLSSLELLRYSLENLGEVSPGLLYRTARPSRELLDFLGERVRLRYVINLTSGVGREEREFLDAVGGEVVQLRMRVENPPTAKQILAMIRLTHRARAEGAALLIHCRAGADRTSAMVGIWRMLFQGVPREDLSGEALLHQHFPLTVPMVFETFARFDPEVFLPFVDDPTLLEDPQRVDAAERAYFQGQPLLSGTRGTTTGPLRAGVAKVDLLAGLELPVQMATYGPSPGPAHGVRREVLARALVVENGGTRLALVSCDVLIAEERWRAEVLARSAARGVRLDDLLLAATHTHTGIGGYVDHWLAELYILGPYQERLHEHFIARVVEAVVNAAGTLRDAELGAGRAFVDGLSFNRRHGETVDPEVGVLALREVGGAPLAAVVNFAAHPVLEPSDGLLSSDYPGVLTRRLDEAFGFGLFLNGALGDLNACAPERPGAWREEGLAESVAAGLFAAIEPLLEEIVTRREVELGSLTTRLRLPRRNFGLVPDLLFPLDWLLTALLDWPQYTPLQVMRLDGVALVAASTEISARLGLRIKRRSPAPYPFVVSHANSYGGYAVTPVYHARSKLDPTSILCMAGASYGQGVVESACDLLEDLFGARLDPDASLLSPAARQRLAASAATPLDEASAEFAAAVAAERGAAALDLDPTEPQSRRFGRLGADRVRFELSTRYLEDLRGGERIDGRRAETSLAASARLPWELELGGRIGYVRSGWRPPGAARQHADGITDLEATLERPWTLYRAELAGSALRLSPRVALAAPTGDAPRSAPFAFSPGSGVWRPAAGAALEWTWDSYHTLSLDTQLRTALERHHGRRPGEEWTSRVGYRERHGLASLYLDLVATVRLKDSRRGGRQVVDVRETSFALGVEPGIGFHLGTHLELIAQASFPLARSGSGLEAGEGGTLGVLVGF